MKPIQIIIMIFAIIGLFYFSLTYYHHHATETSLIKAKEAIMNIRFSCDEGLEERTQRWSETGYSRGCYKNETRHGRWISWEGEYLNIEGNYNNGLEHGEWLVFNENGQIYRRIIYDNGTEKTNEIISRQ